MQLCQNVLSDFFWGGADQEVWERPAPLPPPPQPSCSPMGLLRLVPALYLVKVKGKEGGAPSPSHPPWVQPPPASQHASHPPCPIPAPPLTLRHPCRCPCASGNESLLRPKGGTLWPQVEPLQVVQAACCMPAATCAWAERGRARVQSWHGGGPQHPGRQPDSVGKGSPRAEQLLCSLQGFRAHLHAAPRDIPIPSSNHSRLSARRERKDSGRGFLLPAATGRFLRPPERSKRCSISGPFEQQLLLASPCQHHRLASATLALQAGFRGSLSLAWEG